MSRHYCSICEFCIILLKTYGDFDISMLICKDEIFDGVAVSLFTFLQGENIFLKYWDEE